MAVNPTGSGLMESWPASEGSWTRASMLAEPSVGRSVHRLEEALRIRFPSSRWIVTEETRGSRGWGVSLRR